MQAFVETHLMGINGETPLEHSICMYTMSPDEHFCVGAHPAHPGLFLAAGLSGHGFKFAPVLGEALAQLAMTGHAEAQIDFLSPARFQAAP
jgi:glycine/D-amino acid oxidase-like deaminating enzyme